MGDDRNISVARRAHRAKLIDSDQLDVATNEWSRDKSLPMESVLRTLGWLDDSGLSELDRLAKEEEEEDGGATADLALSTLAAIAERSASVPSDGLPDTIKGLEPPTQADSPPLETMAIDPSSSDPSSATVYFDSSSASLIRLSTLEERGSGEVRHRYTRTRMHAKGGIGQVWLARDGDLGREVALKELRPEQVRNTAAWARFVEEARITGQLEHPGIVPVYELALDPDRGKTFYTMRFIRGRTLQKAVREYHKAAVEGLADPLERARLLGAFVSLCNTVAYAHSRGVIHRDLKGQNVVLGDFGEVILLDWGIAKLVDPTVTPSPDGTIPASFEPLESDDSHEVTMQGQVLGTPFYMAPEQAEGRVDEIDRRTDVYGLGAILYEILTGLPPHGGSTTVEVLRRVVEDQPRLPREVVLGTPKPLEAICLKAMSKRREDRYDTALDLADDVRRWLADEPVTVLREPWMTRAARWAKRHRSAVASSAALIVMAIVGLSVANVLIGRERDEARRQRGQARRAVDDSYTRVAETWLEDRLDPLQREFLEKALAYYRDFADDASSRPERGRANLRLGDVLRKLGRHDEAESAYRRSIDLLRGVARDDAGALEPRELLAEATFRLGSERAARAKGGQLDEADQLYQRASDLQAAVLDQAATTSRRVALGRTLTALAELRRGVGRGEDAEAIFRRALGLLQRAVEDEPAEVVPRQELANAFEALGRLLADRGRTVEAHAAFESSAKLFEAIATESPNLPIPRDGLARVYNSLGLLSRKEGDGAEPEEMIRKEIAINRRLADDYPTRPEYRRTLARGLMNLGIVCRESNRAREAEGFYRQALEINQKLASEDRDTWKFRRDEALCLQALGEIRMNSAAGESEGMFRKALAIFDEQVQQSPRMLEARMSAATNRLNLAIWLDARGRGPEATELARQAVELVEEQAVADEMNLELRRLLARSLTAFGDALLAEDRFPEAEEAYRKAVNALDRLAQQPGATSNDRLELANALSARGNNEVNGKLLGAEESLRRSVALLEALATEGPPTPRLRTRFAAARSNLGDYLVSVGNFDGAEPAYQKAVETFAALATEFPAEVDYNFYLGQVLGSFGKLRIAQKRPADARTLLERAANAEHAVLAANPTRTQAQGPLRDALEDLAQVCLETRDYLAAAKAGEDWLKVADDPAKARASIARLMARCAPLARADSNLPDARRALQAADFDDRAIALLREAVREGDRDAAGLLADPIFDPIRQRDGFKLLVDVAPARIGRVGEIVPTHR